MAASGGVQVIVESHSDHLLNGIRLSAKREMIKPEMINLYYFSKNSRMEPLVESLKIQIDGRLNFWPDGFFMSGTGQLMKCFKEEEYADDFE
ncbi:DUF3696 domain-containing protein [Anaeromicropila populeti]|uniref:DUF3696 domain-containing protein n=1 Tax=Anaeromicropila populeti TaxID=37658 RepID=A0A1I6L4I8_9FIRM|nr:DUF3696 domain-containing protein [Anaeromicropila populeti]SFR98352.1 Protein of unknown function [Anaeromicropila populeti]